ncbi:MAG: UvrABC system protein C [Candidatus Nomurabacteria bacterium GW2011_GWB1_37_5]|uniref:UvrABC system protein C n=1 Tax=Candidatus Nomurabacteria bacterium GW2011_GWB1_37_5 TaxID=1618742 RepID=A0A0G0HAH2_9BACT|nr:MAG: UvrABC system protein C [Candidatus Nomurabacteria bacterium GW2011_GWB1_37_5]
MKRQDLNKYKLPDKPGVYMLTKPAEKGPTLKMPQGRTLGSRRILYIGKATSLRDRVRSYFGKDLIETRGPMILDMVTKSTSIKWQVTDSVLEALILEANLIKKHQPYYNVKEKDDKSFNYVGITDESYPKVIIVRGKDLDQKLSSRFRNASDGQARSKSSSTPGVKDAPTPGVFRISTFSRVFGPFTSGSSLREALKIIRRIFPFLDEKSKVKGSYEFYRQIGLVPDLPVGKGRSSRSDTERGTTLRSRQNYLKNIRNIKLIFEGKKNVILKNLEKEMRALAKEHKFEEANEVKKKIFALKHIQDVALIKDENVSLRSDLEPARGPTFSRHFRIEAYDIAHMFGKDMVGVMTVVENGEIVKSAYRKFSARGGSASGGKTILDKGKPNDPAALREILERRFAHPEWRFPNLIVVDGGKAQLNVANKVIEESGLVEIIKTVSVVKDEKHRPRQILGDQIIARKYESEILLANSESHRFAVKYHRSRREVIRP